MELHYDNPEINAFDDGFAEGINPEEMKKTCSLLLRTPVRKKCHNSNSHKTLFSHLVLLKQTWH